MTAEIRCFPDVCEEEQYRSLPLFYGRKGC
jgi:hypothetical protein